MRSQGFWDKGSAISIAAGILWKVARFSGGGAVPTLCLLKLGRCLPICMPLCRTFWSQMRDFRVHLGYKMPASAYKNVAKTQEQVTGNISRKSRFQVGIIRVGEVCHH